MKLNLKERILLNSLLAEKGNFVEMILIEEIKNKIKVTSEDIKTCEIKQSENGGIVWNEKGFDEIEYDFTIEEKNILKDTFKRLDDDKAITTDNFSVCKKIKELN